MASSDPHHLVGLIEAALAEARRNGPAASAVAASLEQALLGARGLAAPGGPDEGVRPEDLDLQAEGRALVIRGRYAPAGSEGRNVWVRSLPRGDFHFTLTLPVKVETDSVNATLDAGMLHLELPKVAEARTRKIEVRQVQNSAMKAIS